MSDTPQKNPSSAAPQQFVEVKEIKNGVVHLKSGNLRQILIVSGLNFDLKSETEQILILRTFQDFLNTLDFSVQFFVHSRKVNVDIYLERMLERKNQEPNELLKVQIDEYVNFIRSFVEQNAIINKNFFAVVPYDLNTTEAGAAGAAKGLVNLFKQKKSNEKEEDLKESLEQLNHRVSQVVSGVEQIGLRVAPLNDDELVELFYNLYNPQLVEKKGLEISKPQK